MRRDIYHTQLDRGLALAWVNSYSAVVVKTPGATLLFDPVSLLVPQDASVDLIAVSHDHSDHWDPQLVADLQRRTRAVVAAPPFLASRLSPPPSGAPLSPGSCQPSPAPHLQAAQTSPSAEEIPPYPLCEREKWGNSPSLESKKKLCSDKVKPLNPGDSLEVGDVLLTALRCDHAARQPLSFLVRTADGFTVYLPGDSTPFPEMADLLDQLPHLRPGPAVLPLPQGGRPRMDILLWMGTALADGAQIAQLVHPKVTVTYEIGPPAAGTRARGILTHLTPHLKFHALERHQVFVYQPTSRPAGPSSQ
jgi:L-ascorbate metabolism protein UlaG (beta-lactamase superfamily)